MSGISSEGGSFSANGGRSEYHDEESMPLISGSSDPLEQVGTHRFGRVGLAALGAVALLGVVGYASKSVMRHSNSESSEASFAALWQDNHRPGAIASSETPALSITVSNEYNLAQGYPGEHYTFFDSESVIEPMRETTFTAVASGTDATLETCVWTEPADNRVMIPEEDAYFGRSLNKLQSTTVDSSSTVMTSYVTSPGDFTVLVECTLSDGTSLSTSKSLKSLYVRREIRTLTDDDRVRLLEAMLVLYNMESDKQGTELYGRHFHCAKYFANIHLQLAGTRRVDHMHDGMGFLSQHIALTNEFELALQSVDPTVTMPYWDYTIDSVKMRLYNSTADYLIYNCELLTDKWFGSISPTNFHIADGYFSHLEIPKAYDDSLLKSPYGYMRAPWNLNPSKYVTRYHKLCGVDADVDVALKWPTCGTHFRLTFASDYDSLNAYVWEAAYTPHGPVHAWIGGIGGGTCESHADRLQGMFTLDTVANFRTNTFTLLKNLYRERRINFDLECTTDNQEACMFHCERDGDMEDKFYTSLYQDLLITGLDEDVLDSLSEEDKVTLADLTICKNTYWPGDQLEAGSPSDPTFWPIHPTLDRLFQFKVIAQPFKSLEWEGSGAICMYSDTGCEGHHSYDPTYFKTVAYDSTSESWVKIFRTNMEVLTSVYPHEDSYIAPYIYDNFEWDHCKKEGWDFTRAERNSDIVNKHDSNGHDDPPF